MKNDFLSEIINKINPNKDKGKYDVGLILSGGAARGIAHLGVIKFFKEEGIFPDIVSGVSAGSIVGSFICDGFEPEEVLEIFEKGKIFRFVKVYFRKQSLFSLSGLKKVLEKNLRSKNIENLKTPLIIAATDIQNGETRYFNEGNLIQAVMASSSIPVMFNPVKIDQIPYIDGGVTNNFPVEPLELLCKKLIGVHVNPSGRFNEDKGIGHMALYAFHLSVAADIAEKKKELDFFIEPQDLKDYSYFDINKSGEMFQIGYEAAKKVYNEVNEKKR